jgi:hypothetical protein
MDREERFRHHSNTAPYEKTAVCLTVRVLPPILLFTEKARHNAGLFQ